MSVHRPEDENPEFIFHNSPGFETSDGKELQEVLSFTECLASSIALETALFKTVRAGKGS